MRKVSDRTFLMHLGGKLSMELMAQLRNLDDQDSTAIPVFAALINTLQVVDRKIAEAKIVIFGTGATVHAVIRLLHAQGVDHPVATVFDSRVASAVAEAVITASDCGRVVSSGHPIHS